MKSVTDNTEDLYQSKFLYEDLINKLFKLKINEKAHSKFITNEDKHDKALSLISNLEEYLEIQHSHEQKLTKSSTKSTNAKTVFEEQKKNKIHQPITTINSSSDNTLNAIQRAKRKLDKTNNTPKSVIIDHKKQGKSINDTNNSFT